MMISVHIGSQSDVLEYIHLCIFYTISQITCIILIFFYKTTITAYALILKSPFHLRTHKHGYLNEPLSPIFFPIPHLLVPFNRKSTRNISRHSWPPSWAIQVSQCPHLPTTNFMASSEQGCTFLPPGIHSSLPHCCPYSSNLSFNTLLGGTSVKEPSLVAMVFLAPPHIFAP